MANAGSSHWQRLGLNAPPKLNIGKTRVVEATKSSWRYACSQGSQEQLQGQRAQHQDGKHQCPHYEVRHQGAPGCHGMSTSQPRPNIHERDRSDHNWMFHTFIIL